MIIGLCGSGFPEVRNALRAALPNATLVHIAAGTDDHHMPQVDVLVPLGATIDAALMDATRPRLIQQFGVGLQGVDLAAARARHIPVANVPAADTGNAVAVAEIAILHLLALLRRYAAAQRSITQRQVGQPCGATLAGKTIAVAGVGAIGTALIPRLTAFGATPLAIGRRNYTDYPALASLVVLHLEVGDTHRGC